ncbi:MAG: hypothetical protein JWQ49_5200 [Edaphobacter sp.]|nr:hypothetical protein [Edaphobacter sp.]
MKQTKGKAHLRKYHPEILVAMFRKAESLRNEMLREDFTDNGGAIHSAERILNIMGLKLKYRQVGHINNLRHFPKAVFSVEALKLHKSGHKVFIEHVSPLRHLTQKAIEKVEQGASDAQLKAFVKRH